MAQPNENKTLNFVAKVWDEKAQEYKPIYIAPDATDKIQGDVKLSDNMDATLNAATGMTAATPAALQKALANIIINNGEAKSVTGILDDKGQFNFNLNQLDASTVTVGLLPLSVIPHGALERLVKVQNEVERFSLQKSDGSASQSEDNSYVSNGDSVLQLDTNVMYIVVDDTQLSSEAGYQEYAAGTAINASTADRLTTPRILQVQLTPPTEILEYPGTFDGSKDVTDISVAGILPIENGGTAANTAEQAWLHLGGGDIGKLNPNNDITQFLRGDGTWQTIDIDDEKTKQTNSSENTNYPILLKNGIGKDTITDGVLFNSAVTLNPSTGKIAAGGFIGPLEGIADYARRWANKRTITLYGNITGSAENVDGSMDIGISTTLANNTVTTAKIVDNTVTLAKLADNVETIHVGSTEPTDSHIKFWIEP